MLNPKVNNKFNSQFDMTIHTVIRVCWPRFPTGSEWIVFGFRCACTGGD